MPKNFGKLCLGLKLSCCFLNNPTLLASTTAPGQWTKWERVRNYCVVCESSLFNTGNCCWHGAEQVGVRRGGVFFQILVPLHTKQEKGKFCEVRSAPNCLCISSGLKFGAPQSILFLRSNGFKLWMDGFQKALMGWESTSWWTVESRSSAAAAAAGLCDEQHANMQKFSRSWCVSILTLPVMTDFIHGTIFWHSDLVWPLNQSSSVVWRSFTPPTLLRI